MRSRTKKNFLILAAVLAAVLALAACAPQVSSSAGNSSAASGEQSAAASSSAGTAPSDSATTQTAGWSIDGDCAVCHAEEAEAASDAKLLAAAHAATTCATCHTEDAIAAVHEGVTAAPDEDQQKALRKKGRKMATSEFCLTCHGSLEDLAAKTTEVTIVQDSAGNIINPHAVPVNDAHAEGNAQECFSCHRLHSKSPASNSNCQSCHHAGVYECGTCHAVDEYK